MPTIFAIDGSEFGDLGAFSQSVSRLQSWLVTLGQKTGNATLRALVVDGLIGPKTQAATNLAFSKYFSGVGVGALTQAQVAARADELAGYVQAEIAKAYPSTGAVIATVAAKEAPKSTAMVPYQAPAATTIAPTYIPAPVDTSSGVQANIIKWSAIGLGLVVVTGAIYYAIRRRGQPALAGFGWHEPKRDLVDADAWDRKQEMLRRQRRGKFIPGTWVPRGTKAKPRKVGDPYYFPNPRKGALGDGGGYIHDTIRDFVPGQRVQLHPSMDAWMRGDRFGTVLSMGQGKVVVRLDKSNKVKRIRPQNLQIES